MEKSPRIILEKESLGKVQALLQTFPISELEKVEKLIKILNENVEKVEEVQAEEVDVQGE